MNRAQAPAATFEPRGLPLAIARSTLALAELVSIVFTPDRDLFTYESGLPDGQRCYGAHGLSLWCVAGPSADGLFISRLIAIAVLVVAASGYRPRWTCIPHWYVNCSLTASMTLPNGGDEAALIATMLLLPILLGDRRVWHWTRPREPLAPVWAGSAYAAWWALRLQIAIVYFSAAVSKLFTAQWRDGSAMYAVLVDPDYGLPPAVRKVFGPVLASGFVIRPLTWSVLLIELAIAVFALWRPRARRRAVWMAVLLHTGIVAAMGLFSFGLIMMALVLTLRFGDRDPSVPADDPASEPLRLPAAGRVRPAAMDQPPELMEIR